MDSVDLRTARVWVGGEESLAAGLRKRKTQLEEIVAPFVSTDQSVEAIRFKGRKRYLKVGWTKVADAVFALQFLYHILDARKSGDIDAAITAAIGFGGRSDKASMQSATGHDPIDSMFNGLRFKSGQSNRRKGKGDLTPEQWRQVVARVDELLYDCGNNRTEAAKVVRTEIQQGKFGPVANLPGVPTICKKRLE